MLKFLNNFITFDYHKCQQCGICKPICPTKAISYTLLHNGLQNISINQDKCIRCKKCVNACPANKESLFTDYFEEFPNKRYFLGYNKDNFIRRESSSGGVCKTLIIEGLKSGLVDGVYSLKRSDQYPYAEGAFYTKENIPDYAEIPNSVYHSVMVCLNFTAIQKCDKLMIVGTACQLRALEKVVKNKCNILIKVCIFCKQQKTLDSTRFLAKVMGIEIPKNLKFSIRYRGTGWPGIVRMNESELPYSRAAQIPFGKRLWTVPGCNICGDSFGLECKADISLMDPWGIRMPNDLGETLITLHTEKGLHLLQQISDLELKVKTYKEVEYSLTLKDVWIKQLLIPFYRNETTHKSIIRAGEAEILQCKMLQSIFELLPQMPILVYRIICKIFPDIRNLILKKYVITTKSIATK